MARLIEVEQMNNVIAILGASGFIGRRLVAELIREGGYDIRVLVRDSRCDPASGGFGTGVEVYEGDAADLHSLGEFIAPGCIVVNLVYLWGAGEESNMACVKSLLSTCKAKKIARLIHCSTADVVGRVSADSVNEDVRCHPVGEYGTTKLKIEETIVNSSRDHFDAVILRPTSVLGIDGEPLKMLAENITGGAHWKNYLKSCLFNRRCMNLVPVANVVAAMIFLVQHTNDFNGEIFLVSNDDDPGNNFKDVEQFCMDELGVKRYPMPRFPLPLVLLKLLLWSLGRSNINPLRSFDSSKLRKLGFVSPVSLADGLSEYTEWYRRTALKGKKPKNS